MTTYLNRVTSQINIDIFNKNCHINTNRPARPLVDFVLQMR
nr:MAG TPA: hypothetical protein [Caudoviricetes sp.]